TRVLTRARGDRRDIGGNILGVLALEELGRHHRAAVGVGVRVLDPIVDQALDRGAFDPVHSVLPEGDVEVRTHAAGGAGVAQRVAGAAFGHEQLFAVHQV